MIIFLHGFGSSSEESSTGKSIEALCSEEEFVSLSYDSMNPAESIEKIVKFVGMQLDVTLIGVSLGGYLARYIASVCTCSVSKLILLNPALNAPSCLRQFEGTTFNGIEVPTDLTKKYIPYKVEKDDSGLPIYMLVATDDEVVDANYALSEMRGRARIMETTGSGHRVNFTDEVEEFINTSINTICG